MSNKADLADPQWYDLVLENEFKPSGPIVYNRYSRDQFGRITVQFNLVTKTLLNVDNGTKFATLPVGFRPSNRQLEFASYDPQRGKDIVIHLEDGNFTADSSETSGYTAIVTEITFLSGS